MTTLDKILITIVFLFFYVSIIKINSDIKEIRVHIKKQSEKLSTISVDKSMSKY